MYNYHKSPYTHNNNVHNLSKHSRLHPAGLHQHRPARVDIVDVEAVFVQQNKICALSNGDSSLVFEQITVGRVRGDERQNLLKRPIMNTVQFLDCLKQGSWLSETVTNLETSSESEGGEKSPVRKLRTSSPLALKTGRDPNESLDMVTRFISTASFFSSARALTPSSSSTVMSPHPPSLNHCFAWLKSIGLRAR